MTFDACGAPRKPVLPVLHHMMEAQLQKLKMRMKGRIILLQFETQIVSQNSKENFKVNEIQDKFSGSNN